MSSFLFEGVLAALATPFDSAMNLDMRGFAAAADYALAGGCDGLVVGGHTGEFAVLKVEELDSLVRAAKARVEGKVPIIQGLYSESTAEAVERGFRAKANGADGVLVMPPWLFGWGADVDADIIYNHYRTVTESVGLPAIAFCYGPAFGFFPGVVKAIAELKRIVAVKLGGPVNHYEACLRAVHGQVAVLCCADSNLYPCLAVGGEGALVGLASLAPRWCVEVFDSIQTGDALRAQKLNDAFFPLTESVYGAGFLKAPLKLKVGLAALGVIDAAYARPPVLPLSQLERRAIARALEVSGLHDEYRQQVGEQTGASTPRRSRESRRARRQV